MTQLSPEEIDELVHAQKLFEQARKIVVDLHLPAMGTAFQLLTDGFESARVGFDQLIPRYPK